MYRLKVSMWLCFAVCLVLTGCQIHRVPAKSAQNIYPLMPGEPIPEISLSDSSNQAFNLNKSLSAKPAVLIFYRGGWCPHCTNYLVSLNSVAQELKKIGYQVVAVTPEKYKYLTHYPKISNLDFKFLSDCSMKISTAMGIAFKATDEQVKKYKKTYHIDIEEDSGYKHHLLPVPALFIVGTDGVVRYTFTDPNYKQRLSPEQILKIAKREL